MTDKELRRLKRAELLEILYYLQKENEELKAELERQREEADQLRSKPVQSTVSGLPEDFMQQITQAVRDAVSDSKKRGRKKHR